MFYRVFKIYKKEFNSKCHVYSLPSLEAYIVTHQKQPDADFKSCLDRNQASHAERKEEARPLIIKHSEIDDNFKAQLEGRSIELESGANATTLHIEFEINSRPSPLVKVTDLNTQKTTAYYMGAFGTNKIPDIENSPAIDLKY